MSEETLRKIAMQVRNWGRWGADDEIGTLNFITPEAVVAACRLAPPARCSRSGSRSSVRGRRAERASAFNPIHTMFRDGGDVPKTPRRSWRCRATALRRLDRHAAAVRDPVDSLAHVFYEGKMYNGYDAALVTSSGTAKNSIDKTKSRIAGRGVLLDVARWKGVRALEPGYAITPDDLDATAAAQKVEIRRGDLLLIRTATCPATSTGRTGATTTSTIRRGCRCTPHRGCTPGRSRRSPPTTTQSRCDLHSCPVPEPLHICAIPNMGLTLGEIFYLEELAADCAADGRYAFLLVASPLPVTRGVARRSTPTP